MRVIACLLLAIALQPAERTQADERTQELVKRLAQEADAFEKNAPLVVGREVLHQRTLYTPPRPKIRIGKAVSQSPQPYWQEREIISQYGFALLGRSLHELRQITWVDGKQVTEERKAQDDLAGMITSNDDQRKRRSLLQIEKYGLRGSVTDFGQILLLFNRAALERFEFPYLGPRMLSPTRMQAFHYQQLDGPQPLAVYRQDQRGQVQHLGIEGEIWVRESDGLPLRITMNAGETGGDASGEAAGLREQAVVEYAESEFGTLLPFATVHRETRGGVLVTENKFTYSAFHKFGAAH